MGGSRKAGPYSRTYGPWVDELAARGAGRLQLLVMACLCERLEFDHHGNASAWYPRAEMAERLGVPEKAVKEAVRGLKSKGLLKVKRSGHSGRATVYAVMPGRPWPDLKPAKGPHGNTPTGSATIHPEGVGVSEQGLKGCLGDTPLRHKSLIGGLLARREAGQGEERDEW